MTEELQVAGMTCGHCVRAVTLAIQKRDPAAKVEVDLEAGRVRADSRLSRDEIAALVTAEGYSVAA
ncbi:MULTISPECIES: heavy-metal-associated domain-containing protein [Roseomonadaceae]|uniref:Heavy-metal-associated domain-containing protein n=1 Tax=Falsiroseomonas oleicola TaxID=2801474 RepID=A0ABS6H2N0_9PROT|nr:cation transporter [Roseomonas oleicola]MBU8542914.1 heavy-metal-associated domain-containing protein [Roseomonas oleicola]